MLSQIITHVGTGTTTVAAYDLKFDACAAWIVPEAAAYIGYHHRTMWCARSNTWGAQETITGGIRILGRKLLLGGDASVNTTGVTYRIVVIGAESGDVETPSWCGNATAGRTIKLNKQATPIFASVKRDNALPPVCKVAGAATMAMDGTTVTDSIALGSGVLTLTAAAEVNQYVSASGLGEGIDGLVIHAGSGATVGNYTGTGAAQQVAIGCDPAILFIWRSDTPAVGNVIVRNALSGLVASADANAPAIGGFVTAGRLVLSGTVANASGGTYQYLAIPYREPVVARSRAPAVIVRKRKALAFNGRGTLGYVDCGTGLNINGPITLEWFGHLPGESLVATNNDGWLLGKAATTQSATVGASWGMSVVNCIDEFSHGWQGQQATVVVNGRVYYVSPPLATMSWRTGIIVPWGYHLHQVVHRGGGEFEYWLDGVLVKQHKRVTDGIPSNAAHRVTMGARWNGSAYQNNSRMNIVSARVYGRALTEDELRIRATRAMYNSMMADIVNGLQAAWHSSDLGGSTWVDPVGGNNGTITGGTILEL